ncbi:two-component hybrid sensor and regulator [Calothrix sp. NIES-4071]|nr:two-component hybrid sensor and regulator [Calothrix sp. NIES-4071]BAZ56734.1 two-component hybrid sensor and regulator [Calothrix sp. NIES-4105]
MLNDIYENNESQASESINPVDSLEVLLHKLMNRVRQYAELSDILSVTVHEVRVFLETDRVKIYKFDTDGSGEVVAESVNERLPSLLGQHFPAEDIPLEAREMFQKVRQRSIVDVANQTIGLSRFLYPDSDNNDIWFRHVDPCHAEYLISMGVQSSVVVPILHRQQLWGLLVSHHSKPRYVTERELQVVQLVADQLSIAVGQSTLLEQTRILAQQEATINRVAKLLHSMTEMQLQQALELTVSGLQASGGRVYIASPQNPSTQIYSCGSCILNQDYEQQPEFLNWLSTQPTSLELSHIWVINDLLLSALPEYLALEFSKAEIRSLLIIRLEYRTSVLGYLSIFRRSVDVETLWARRQDSSDARHLRPVQSFEAWRELKKAQVNPWTAPSIDLANSLASHFAMAIHQYQLYQKVHAVNFNLHKDIEQRKQFEAKISALNTELETRVTERTAQLEQTNSELKHEIKERQQAQASVERLSRYNELILNSAGEGIYGLDESAKLTFINSAGARMLGYRVEELITLGKHFLHFVLKHSKSDGTSYKWSDNPIRSTLEYGKVQNISDDIYYRRDGTKFPVEYISTPIEEQGQIIGAVVIFKDITERQIIERMKDEFVSVVSHELRTPLTSICSALGLLSHGSLDSQPVKRQRMLEIAFENTNRLVRLINDILDIERINSGKVTMHFQICNSADLMTQAVDEMRAMAEKAEITLCVIPLHAQLWADPDRVVQTLTNLISNAIKFSPSGSTVWLSAETKMTPHILFQVKDQGWGIPEDKLETIFDRFQQVDASNSRNQGGTGLGLAICRSIIQQHGGAIWAESVLERGSTFYFTLPLLRGT